MLASQTTQERRASAAALQPQIAPADVACASNPPAAQTEAGADLVATKSTAVLPAAPVEAETPQILTLREELDQGTALRLPEGVRKIIGSYCGVVFQTNFPGFQSITYPLLGLDQLDIDKLAIGDCIDAKDHHGKWYQAEILNINDGQIKVHYVDWDHKWDEWLKLQTESEEQKRVDALGKHSTLYYFNYAPARLGVWDVRVNTDTNEKAVVVTVERRDEHTQLTHYEKHMQRTQATERKLAAAGLVGVFYAKSTIRKSHLEAVPSEQEQGQSLIVRTFSKHKGDETKQPLFALSSFE